MKAMNKIKLHPILHTILQEELAKEITEMVKFIRQDKGYLG